MTLPPQPVFVRHHHHRSQSVNEYVNKEEVLFKDLVNRHPHHEIWGVRLKDPMEDVKTQIILRKILNYNQGKLPQARSHLKGILDWRERHRPLELFDTMKLPKRLITLVTHADGTRMMRWDCRLASLLVMARSGQEMLMWNCIANTEFAMFRELQNARLPVRDGTRNDPYRLVVLHDLGGSPIGGRPLLPLRSPRCSCPLERAYVSSKFAVEFCCPEAFGQHLQYNLPPATRAARRCLALAFGRDKVSLDRNWVIRQPDLKHLRRVLLSD